MQPEGPNAQQIAYWNEVAGPRWVAMQEVLDELIGEIGRQVMERAGIVPGDRVVDVGCGCGQTSLQLARNVGEDGEVVGMDISAPMLARASARVRQAGFSNVRFENADVQCQVLPSSHFDLAFSRFGVMFFRDPVRAFSNVRGALRPGGRLVFVCWRPAAENPWMLIPLQAVSQHMALPAPSAPEEPGPFSLGDEGRVKRILDGAGFKGVHVEALDASLQLGGGRGVDAAIDFVVEAVGPVAAALREAEAGPELLHHVRAALHEALAPHERAGSVSLGCAAWLVTARRS